MGALFTQICHPRGVYHDDPCCLGSTLFSPTQYNFRRTLIPARQHSGSGPVELAMETKTGTLVVFKWQLNDKDQKHNLPYILWREARILRILQSLAYIVPLQDTFANKHYGALITKFAGDMDLLDYINHLFKDPDSRQQHLPHQHPLSWAVLLNLSVQIASAVAELHTAGVAHRDLKPENFTLNVGTHKITLIDFAFAWYQHDSKSHGLFHDTHSGTVGYMSPESYQCNAQLFENHDPPYDLFRADVWALGCVLACLWTGFRSERKNPDLPRIRAMCCYPRSFFPVLDHIFVLRDVRAQDVVDLLLTSDTQ